MVRVKRFERIDGTTRRFWQVRVEGAVVVVTFGRIGTDGTTKGRAHATPEKARAAADTLIREKVDKGYVETRAVKTATKTTAPAPQTAARRATRTAAATAKPTVLEKVTTTSVELPPLTITVATTPPHSQRVLGLGVDDGRVVAVGGQGVDLVFTSTDGATFEESSSPAGPGLRSAFVRGDEVWVVGEYGCVARSRDFGATWKRFDAKTTSCLYGVTIDDEGVLWVAGGQGSVFRKDARTGKDLHRFRSIKVSVSRILNTPLGVLLPTDAPGGLYIGRGNRVTATALSAGPDMMTTTYTPAGTIIVVGFEGHIHRSTDRGASFRKIKIPTKALLTGVDVLDDGRICVVGFAGTILLSDDDGQTFQRVPQKATRGDLWTVKRYRDGFLIGGDDGLILRLGPASAGRTAARQVVPVRRR